MAGFTDDKKSFFNSIIENIKKVSSFGMAYEDLVVKNSQAVGITEAQFLQKGGIKDESFLFGLRRADTTTKQYIAYFDKDYKNKRHYLQGFAQNPEIEFILDTICDESIVYDEKNFWGYFSFMNHDDVDEETYEKVQKRYKEIYNLFGFNQDISAWHLFRKFLVDGIIAFEIVFDKKGKNIVGFKELDPASLVPTVEAQPDGSFVDIWMQYPDNPTLTRKLYDSQIIYISYAKGGGTSSRVSYCERMIRSFNLLRIMEHTRIIWNVMNSSYRMAMTVPIGTRSPQKAKQTLGELMSIYKEDIRLDTDSGELTVDGRPKIQFFKNYLMPSSPNGTPDIQPLPGGGDATAFSDTTVLKYFANKLRMDSKIPATRFGREESGSEGTITFTAEGLDQEEIRFSKFINRLRSIYQDILMKPLWVQFCLDFPHLKKDYLIKSEFGLDYVKENIFREAKEMEVLLARKDQIIKISGLMNSEGKKYFNMDFLVDRWLGVKGQDLLDNNKAKKKAAEEKKKAEEEAGTSGEEGGSTEASGDAGEFKL
jgi:hypothetical protein